MAAFLERDTLCYPEIDLFHAINKWCMYQCNVQRVRATGENCRNIIGDAIFGIRFLAISEEDFERHVVRSGILSDHEVNAIIETRISGTGNYKYLWALPERNKRAWYCKYFTIEQIKNYFWLVLCTFFILVVFIMCLPILQYLMQIYQVIHCKRQEIKPQMSEQQRNLTADTIQTPRVVRQRHKQER